MSTTQRIGGNSVQAYPPVPMTANTTNITNSTYANGTYIATVSSDINGSATTAYQPFQQLTTTTGYVQFGSPSTPYYNSTTPCAYNQSTTTITSNSGTILGGWLQLKLPYAIVVSSYYILSYTPSATGYLGAWYLVGSKDGINWTSISYVSGNTALATTTNVTISNAYSYFRLIVTNQSGTSTYNQYGPIITNLVFYGTQTSLSIGADGQLGVGVTNPANQLEVAGNIIGSLFQTCSGTVSVGTTVLFPLPVYGSGFFSVMGNVNTVGVTQFIFNAPNGFNTVNIWSNSSGIALSLSNGIVSFNGNNTGSATSFQWFFTRIS